MAVPTLALVAVLAALVVVTVALFLPRPAAAPTNAIYLSGTGAARGARGILLVADDATATVFASGLSDLASGYRYVAWEVTDKGYSRIGSLVTLGGGRARITGGTTSGANQIEITIEASTSTGAPEGPTVLAGFTLE